MSEDRTVVALDGESLTLAALEKIARDPRVQVAVTPAALERIRNARQLIEAIVRDYENASASGTKPLPHVYGVTTGFGEFKDFPVAPPDLLRLQGNIILSHLVGAGESADADDPANYFPPDVVRAALALRVNAFARGHSGVRPELAQCLLAMLNRGVIPLVPTRGSVGSSGDLCPLAHLFAAFVGHGRFYVVSTPEALAPGRGRELQSVREFWQVVGVSPLAPVHKEGLALTNGATFSAAMLALAVCDAERIADTADVAAALSLEAACGHTRAFDPKVHRARNLAGQQAAAANLLRLLDGSRLVERSAQVQDAYSLRCAPQVHGASRDAIAFARSIATAEINAATDNPLFFPDETAEPCDARFRANWPAESRDVHAHSAGNFHGQPVALAADFLAIALAELASISERRIQLLLDRAHNRNLPPNLAVNPGVESGMMLLQYAAAGIVSENKVLTHPASVDSIPTSANTEDHNSMATIAARKLRTVVAHAQTVLAMELLVAAQAAEWRATLRPDPNASPSNPWSETELTANRFRELTSAPNRPAIAAQLGTGTAAAYTIIRDAAAPLTEDRPMDGDVRAVRALIESPRFLDGIERALSCELPVFQDRS